MPLDNNNPLSYQVQNNWGVFFLNILCQIIEECYYMAGNTESVPISFNK